MDNYIWGLGAIGVLILLVYSLAFFGKSEKNPSKLNHSPFQKF